MAQPQRPAVVHQDELCPPNKRYALVDANKNIDLESKIMANIIQNHPLRFSVAASSFVSWIYLGQFWHTLQEDGSKYRLKFMLDQKDSKVFRNGSILSEYSWFYSGATITIQLQTTGLVQPWQTLDKIFTRCLTIRVTGHYQPPLQIMRMLYRFINNTHVDYAELLWEGLHYVSEPGTTFTLPL
ncbi:hypothetical protein Tco_0422637 [Tanacetum coccineum]